ncbi:hypothetical protein N7457_009292 [Penicillium paradoxum]|uniref:uncharacterized protein n=1 Tax=Penicillium paradoxum TaxID=176176 RepID=UPI0025477531|nr:uncharacterized protein N7457_009292 [Penicillium paradoxum]KAJ5774396.1 hypothetical protein N7457_009292 [Penicillium paradoxum]
MAGFIHSQESSPKTSISQSSSVEDFHSHHESHASPLQRLKKRWKHIQKKWGPLMAAKENWDDEYTFPSGRYAGQGI